MNCRAIVLLLLFSLGVSGCASTPQRTDSQLAESYRAGMEAAEEEIAAGRPTVWTFGLIGDPPEGMKHLPIHSVCGCVPNANLLEEIEGHNARIATFLKLLPEPAITDPRIKPSRLLFSDDFISDSGQWASELEKGGTVAAGKGELNIDVPGGATVWFKPLLHGPLIVEYEATVVKAGGPNDRVSDLNCFWMARDARKPDDLFAVGRSGKFADYNPLVAYYVGLGGNGNTTTRFRRYIGDPTIRPLLPEHDLAGAENLITPNATQTIQLVATGPLIQYYRNGKRIFEMHDEHPYTSGWFGFRTVSNHMILRKFRVWALEN